MDLSIIIVNWNSARFVDRCIASIVEETSAMDFEIIVIDAASFDGVDRMLKTHYPYVRFIQATKNGGFAASNNAAFAESRGRYTLFLNPDTLIRDRAIDRAFGALQSLNDAGMLGCRLLNGDGTLQVSCIQAFPSLTNQVFNINVLRGIFPSFRIWGAAPLFDDSLTDPCRVDVVSGAFMMGRREVIEAVGRFSEDYFMYSEDVDLCYKMYQAGFKNYYLPLVTVVHFGGASSDQHDASDFSSFMMMESRWRFFRKTRPGWYCGLYRGAILFSSLVRILITLALLPIRSIFADVAHSKRVLRKWGARMKWTLGWRSFSHDA